MSHNKPKVESDVESVSCSLASSEKSKFQSTYMKGYQDKLTKQPYSYIRKNSNAKGLSVEKLKTSAFSPNKRTIK